MIIISDTSVLSNIIQIDQEELLFRLFETVIVPQAVHEELLHKKWLAERVEKLDWLEVRSVSHNALYNELVAKLDPGESEAIILALELNADLLLIDERKGRKIATEQGVIIIGLVGLLARAKKRGYLDAVKPHLDRLIYEIGFRFSPTLYQEVLRDLGEI